MRSVQIVVDPPFLDDVAGMSVAAAQIGGRHARLMLFQNADDLLIGKPGSFHCLSPSLGNRLTEKRGSFRGAGQYASKFATKSKMLEDDLRDVMIYPLHLHDHRPSVLKLKKRNYELERMRRLTDEDVRRRREILKQLAENEAKKTAPPTLNHFVGL